MYDYIWGITCFFWTLSVYILWAKESHFEIFYGVSFIFNFENLNLTILKKTNKQTNKKQTNQKKKKNLKQQPNSKKTPFKHGVETASKLNVNF